MKRTTVLLLATLLCVVAGVHLARSAPAQSLADQRETLFGQLKTIHGYTDAQMTAVRGIFAGSPIMGQGNPAVTEHPLTPEECREKAEKAGAKYENADFEKICGAKYMAPLYNPAVEKAEDATACIDQFEFPDIPCAYPVIWVKAREAAEICEAVGKRMCDAHEWEGACAGALLPPDYRFDLAKGRDPESAIRAMRSAHNRKWEATKSWSYGPTYKTGICGASSHKTPGCNGGSWTGCGSNTFPDGSFPDCHSSLGVYDLNGNAAEHMNLPLNESQMASRGSKELGYTEMKGSWFIFDQYHAHDDWCRWRAPFWHGTRVMAADSHANYHLGFRCCKTLEGKPKK
jgi:formylglycine-generating enzyme required for sulfatase activity